LNYGVQKKKDGSRDGTKETRQEQCEWNSANIREKSA
jgi:hypothetical protein